MLSITNFNLSYPGYPDLATVDWRIDRGQQVALLGRSGTGKSTLLKAIVHADQHDEIELKGMNVAYLAQEPVLMPWLTVAENLRLGAILRGDALSHADHQRVSNLLAEVGLPGFEHRHIHSLSGGQKARVALARVLFERANCVLLDEPFAGLDRSTRIQMAALCKTLLTEQTLILVTHDPVDARHWLTQAMVLTEQALTGPHNLTDFEDDQRLLTALGAPA